MLDLVSIYRPILAQRATTWLLSVGRTNDHLHTITKTCYSFYRKILRKEAFRRACSVLFIVINLYVFFTRTIYQFQYGIVNNYSKTNFAEKTPNAFIITTNCGSNRFKITKMNIERVFPKFFNVICFSTIPLNDSRIHTANISLWKKFSSNLLSAIEIWTREIPKYSNGNESEWTFIFEDDVNFNNPSAVFLPDFIAPLQHMMYNNPVVLHDGFFYLGICGPKFDTNHSVLIARNTKEKLTSHKGCGLCFHATAITRRRAKLFWTDVSSYRPDLSEASLDLLLESYCIRSGKHFYTFGTNYLYPPGTGHYGIAFQDRGRFSTEIN